MLAQALLGVEKTDRLDKAVWPASCCCWATAGLFASPRSCEGAESMAPFPAASSIPEALADAMSESCSKICSILETDATMKGAKACSPHKIAGKRS
jgi:hypothetical protein